MKYVPFVHGITLVKDIACFKGSLLSILIDSKCPEPLKNKILDEVDKCTTNGNNTETGVFFNNNSLEDFFIKPIPVQLYKGDDFRNKIGTIDNKCVYGLLLWQGKLSVNHKGEQSYTNSHATRFCFYINNKLVLMDPSPGKEDFIICSADELIDTRSLSGLLFVLFVVDTK